MSQPNPNQNTGSVMGPYLEKNLVNITTVPKILSAIAVGIPAVVTTHDRNYVAITG
jgi:hypothetical protein